MGCALIMSFTEGGRRVWQKVIFDVEGRDMLWLEKSKCEG